MLLYIQSEALKTFRPGLLGTYTLKILTGKHDWKMSLKRNIQNLYFHSFLKIFYSNLS